MRSAMTWLVFLGVALAALVATPVRAQGVAELSLDRGAVRALLGAVAARPLTVMVPSWGALTLHIAAPDTVAFVDGGVETDLQFTLPELDLQVMMRVRYEPVVDETSGVVSLSAVTAIPEVNLPVDVDLAPMLPAVELPRRLSWTLDGPAGGPLPVQAMVQGVVIDSQRLVVQLGLHIAAGAGPRR